MKRSKGNPINGWVILDKPAGLSSTQAMAKVRWLLNARKAGHGGTLDPFATGVLPIAMGEATKLISHVLDGNKVYAFTVQWGAATDSDDCTGKTIATSDTRPDAEAIRTILPRFIGCIRQVPPQFSAVHVDGERAYDLARDGVVMDLPARDITITRFDYKGAPTPDTADFEVACSKGTYIRSLARDMGALLGCHGHVKTLKRLASGPFRLESAISLESLAEIGQKESRLESRSEDLRAFVLPLASVLDDIPAVLINEQETRRLRQGQAIALHPMRVPSTVEENGLIALKDNNDIVALARMDLLGTLSPVRVFNL
jgi:tRNA pseudouridine55 synthase